MKLLLKGACLACIGAISVAAANADEVKLDLPVFPVPSLSAFTPPVIKAKGFDKANGLDLNIVTKAAGTYRTDFAAGTNKLGGSGTVLADVAKLNEKGVKTIYLFNVFDYWGTVVVPAASDIRSLKDLNGKKLAASLPTTNYALFRYFAQTAGVDLSSLKVQGSPVPGLVPMAVSGRVDAVQMWEPAHSVLTYKNSDYRALDLTSNWKKQTGFSAVPYLGVAAHKEWVDENAELIPKLYQSYKMAADFIVKNPEEAAQIVSDASGGKLKTDMLVDLIKSDRLALNVYWGNAFPDAANAVFKAATETAYLKAMPSSDVLYAGK
jgi:ABC-type nitrate/sulfonate/bicarbonate transport system substrate-binding protein